MPVQFGVSRTKSYVIEVSPALQGEKYIKSEVKPQPKKQPPTNEVIELLKLSDNKTFDFFPEQSFVGNHPYKGNDKSLRVLFKTNIDPEKTYTLTSYYQNKIKLYNQNKSK